MLGVGAPVIGNLERRTRTLTLQALFLPASDFFNDECIKHGVGAAFPLIVTSPGHTSR
jgi:hypothetical protein